MSRKKTAVAIMLGLFFFCWLWLLPGKGEAPKTLQVRVTGGISGYQSNPIILDAPEAGFLRIEIRDETTLFRALEQEIPEGKSQLSWDGLGWNEERMPQKEYSLRAELAGKSGAIYSAGIRIQVIPAQQAVLFSLPSDPEVYLEENDWFLEFKMLFTDQLVSQFYALDSGEMVLQSSRQMKGGRVNRISYSALTGKHRLPEGGYRVVVYGQQHPSYTKEFQITVRAGKRPVLPLKVTGEIMPDRGDSDAEIWEKMMAPSAVVDIRNVAHQRVYAEKSRDSTVLGLVHGQSQCLSVLEIAEEWVRVSAWNHEKGEKITGWVPKKVLKVVQPQSEYGLLVDKKAQTLTVYREGVPLDTLLVSTGRMAKGELYQETAAGSFLTNEHMSDYSTNGLKYDFVIRYDGGNLLHQIPYAWNESGKKDLNPGELYLGTKASHACIRVQETPSEKGINAYWFWTHLPYHTRIIVLDDAEERVSLERRITGNTPDLEEGLQHAWRVDAGEEEERIVMHFGGDVVLGGRESYYGDPEGLPAILEKEGLSWPFRNLKSLFEHDDLTVVNLECVLKDDPAGEDLTKQWRFRGLRSYAQALREGGIDAVNLANNHTIDYGDAGYESTRQALEGVAEYFGNGRCRILEIRGARIGLGGCRETTYKADPAVIARDIAHLREQGADFIIYQCHWGTEYDPNYNVLQEAMARACARAGADLVIGHHPHVVQGMDWIGSMPVIYSLGNLMFGGTIRLTEYDGLMAQVIFYPHRQEDRLEIRLIPILTSGEAKNGRNNYQPCIALDEDGLRILKKVQKDTGWLLTDRVALEY